MKRVVLLTFLYAGFLLPLRAQDSPSVRYFDGNFQVRDFENAYYYGVIQPVSKRQSFATLYNSSQVKVATVGYSSNLDYKQGKVTGFFTTGDTQFVCQFSKDRLTGPWESWYLNGQLCDSGRLKNNAPDGLWKSWYPSGQLRMVAEYNANRLSDIKDDMQRVYRPIFTFSPAGGSRMSPGFGGNSSFLYQQSLYQEMHLATHPPEIIGMGANLSLKIKEDYNTIITAPDNKRYAPPFNECIVHGVYKSYFPDGTLKDSGYCYNGVRIGVWQVWDETQELKSVGFYKKGLKRDQWMYYNKNGKLVYITRYTRWGKKKDTMYME